MIENLFELFKCNSSYSRPTPSVKWYIRNTGKETLINSNISVYLIPDGNGFISAQSELNISVSKENQGAEIYCTGTNGLGAEVSSRNITLNVYCKFNIDR